jgi:hypothetical protein
LQFSSARDGGEASQRQSKEKNLKVLSHRIISDFLCRTDKTRGGKTNSTPFQEWHHDLHSASRSTGDVGQRKSGSFFYHGLWTRRRTNNRADSGRNRPVPPVALFLSHSIGINKEKLKGTRTPLSAAFPIA